MGGRMLGARTAAWLAGLVILSCAVQPPPPPNVNVRKVPGYEESVSQISSLGLVCDAAIVQDVIAGEDYYCVDGSNAAASFMASAVTQYLESEGFKIEWQAFPFVGAFMPPDSAFKVADQEGSAVTDRRSPFFVAGTLSEGALREDLETLILSVSEALTEDEPRRSEVFAARAERHRRWAAVADKSGQGYLLVILGHGGNVPRKKTFAQSFCTGCLTGLATGGLLSVSTCQKSYLLSSAAMVDLKKGQLLWSNVMATRGGNPFERCYYAEQWARPLLYHLPSRESRDLAS